MSFKSVPNEFTFDQVVQLFNDFDPINETHVKKISDPRGGECYWVLNTDAKLKGKYHST